MGSGAAMVRCVAGLPREAATPPAVAVQVACADQNGGGTTNAAGDARCRQPKERAKGEDPATTIAIAGLGVVAPVVAWVSDWKTYRAKHLNERKARLPAAAVTCHFSLQSRYGKSAKPPCICASSLAPCLSRAARPCRCRRSVARQMDPICSLSSRALIHHDTEPDLLPGLPCLPDLPDTPVAHTCGLDPHSNMAPWRPAFVE